MHRNTFALSIAVVIGLLVNHTLFGQTPGTQYTRALVPLVLGTPTPGALGSLWTTEFIISNSSQNTPVSVFPLFFGGPSCDACTGTTISANTTARPFIETDVTGQRGTFLYIDRALVAQVEMSLRVRDVSRALESYGTSIPIVQEDRFVARTLTINDIPASPEFRQTLRIYGLDSSEPTEVITRLYGRTPPGSDNPFRGTTDILLAERRFALSISAVTGTQYPTRPAFIEISGLEALGGADGYVTTRIDVSPVDAAERLWAFVSITSNTTQHVSVIEPVDLK